MIAALNVDKLRLDMGDYLLSVQSLRKRIGGRTILDGVDLDVKRKTLTVLAGPADAGKSVTLACIAGALRPSSGRIRYFGYEMRGRAQERIARMGVVRTHQCPALFAGMTVIETATTGALLRRPRVARARAHAREMLALAGLSGCDDIAAAALDAGGRRRLELARALATDPQLLLLDDAWAGLDDTERANLPALLAAVRERGITIVAATRTADHFATLADDVVEIDRGTTAGTGAHAAIDLRV